MVDQKEIKLSARQRGFHLITNEIIRYIPKITGISAVGDVTSIYPHNPTKIRDKELIKLEFLNFNIFKL